VIALTTFDLNEYVYAARKAGASGFLLKDLRRDQPATTHIGRSRNSAFASASARQQASRSRRPRRPLRTSSRSARRLDATNALHRHRPAGVGFPTRRTSTLSPSQRGKGSSDRAGK
jgi:DNA-binding NarL/FixJ family response regulator